MPGLGLGTTLHALPFQCSIKRLGVVLSAHSPHVTRPGHRYSIENSHRAFGAGDYAPDAAIPMLDKRMVTAQIW